MVGRYPESMKNVKHAIYNLLSGASLDESIEGLIEAKRLDTLDSIIEAVRELNKILKPYNQVSLHPGLDGTPYTVALLNELLEYREPNSSPPMSLARGSSLKHPRGKRNLTYFVGELSKLMEKHRNTIPDRAFDILDEVRLAIARLPRGPYKGN